MLSFFASYFLFLLVKASLAITLGKLLTEQIKRLLPQISVGKQNEY